MSSRVEEQKHSLLKLCFQSIHYKDNPLMRCIFGPSGTSFLHTLVSSGVACLKPHNLDCDGNLMSWDGSQTYIWQGTEIKSRIVAKIGASIHNISLGPKIGSTVLRFHCFFQFCWFSSSTNLISDKLPVWVLVNLR